MNRPLLSEEKLTPDAAEQLSRFHRDIVDQVRATVEREPVVIVGMAQNPVVKQARKALDAAGIAYTYLEYGSYFGMWKQRLAIKLWSGWPTFPQVFVRGTLLGGSAEARKALADGSFQKLLG